MHSMIVAIVDHSLLDTLCDKLRGERIYFTYWDVKGVGKEVHVTQGGSYSRLKIEVIAQDRDVERVKEIITEGAPRGIPGAGIIAIYHIDEFMDLSEPKRA
jgi:nitrogen regulatory protein PII